MKRLKTYCTRFRKTDSALLYAGRGVWFRTWVFPLILILICTYLIASNTNLLVATSRAQGTTRPSFQLVNEQTGESINEAALFYKEDEDVWQSRTNTDPDSTPPWCLYQVWDSGELTFQEQQRPILKNAELLVVANGYEPLRVQLNKVEVFSDAIETSLNLVPLPLVELKVVTPNGAAAKGCSFELTPPEQVLEDVEHRELFRFRDQLQSVLNINATTDENGNVQFASPAFGASVSYRLLHPSGYAVLNKISRQSVPDTCVPKRIDLQRYALLRGKYLPKIGPRENLELYRLLDDRMTRVDPAIPINLDSQGNFEVSRLIAGWYILGHRIHFGGAAGGSQTSSLVSYERFRLEDGQVIDRTIGADGRPVLGRLVLPPNYRWSDHLFELSIDADIERPIYPHPPAHLTKEADVISWWNAYWDSDVGKKLAECNARAMSTAADADGRFYLPYVKPGTYRLIRIQNAYNLSSPLALPVLRFTVPDEVNQNPFDLGDIAILSN